MRSKKFFLIFCGSLFVAGALSVLLAPFAVAAGLRVWIARTAQQEGLRIAFGKIEAPLLRPVVVHDLQVDSQPESPFQIRIGSPRVELALNLSALFSHARGHILRALTTDGITVDIRRNPQATSQRFAWRTLGDLLADNFKLSGLELHVDNGETIVDLEGGTLSGAQIEAGLFRATRITVVSPWFRKSFSDLRGTTSWQENRLSVGALTLTRGLDIDAIKIDLSQISESRIGLELNMDAFGGKLRASVSSDDQADKRTWDVAGTASEISLAQMSEALDFTDCAGGSLHVCKFTFRGETTNLRQATATVWAEVTGLTWRDRTADTIILGASLYNRQVQIEQVFVKQRTNQLTLTGESSLPEKVSDWLNPDFRGYILASIDDLGDFARLFGARPSDFEGKIEIAGNVSARERKLGGQLTVSGKSLVLFRAPVESLEVKLSLKESELEIANFELCRKNDFLRGQANVNFAPDASYSGKFTISIAEVADYVDLMPEALRTSPFGGRLDLDWSGKGAGAGHSGTFRCRGSGLHPVGSSLIPFNAELEGDYSPDNVLFKQCNLSNPHASFSALPTVAKDYFQLQSLRFDLNGSPKLQGNIFLPISLSKLEASAGWLTALSDNPVLDLNLTLDSTDLGELAKALFTQPKMLGQASGNFDLHGAVGMLDGKSVLHLQNFAFGNEPRLSANLEAEVSRGVFRGKGSVLPLGSNLVDCEWSLPYGFEKQESFYSLKAESPFVATANFPVVLVSKLPRYLSQGVLVDGILSGRLALSNALLDPRFAGEIQVVNARVLGGPALSGKVTFQGQSGIIEFAQLTQNHVQYGARGLVDFLGWKKIKARILPSTPMVMLTPLETGDCVSGIEFSAPSVGSSRRERLGELTIHGDLLSSDWTISLSDHYEETVTVHSTNVDGPLEALERGDSMRTYSICLNQSPSSKTLTLGLARPAFP